MATVFGEPASRFGQFGGGECPVCAALQGELQAVADLIAALRSVRSNEAASLALIVALVAKVAGLRGGV